MSGWFFDEVETIVADGRLLEVQHAGGQPPNFVTLPYSQLEELAPAVRKKLNGKVLMKPETIHYYFLCKWLGEDGNADQLYAILSHSEKYRARTTKRADGEAARNVFNAMKGVFAAPEWRELTPRVARLSRKSMSKARMSVRKDEEERPSEVKESDIELEEAPSYTPEPDEKLTKALRDICAQLEAVAEERDYPIDLFDPVHAKLEEILDSDVGYMPCLQPGQTLTQMFCKSLDFESLVCFGEYISREVKFEDFSGFRTLGRGAFGLVSAVQKNDTKALFAMKEMDKKQIKKHHSAWMVVNEKNVLKKMTSAFVLGLNYAFENKDNLVLMFEICSGGDLKHHLHGADGGHEGGFSVERCQFYAAEVLLGLDHIHSFDIVYRDLKPANVLLDNEGHVIISDLGLAIKLRKNKILKHLAGTAGYWAPEIVSKTGTYKQSDFFSYGVMLYEMMVGHRPKCHCRKDSEEWCPFGTSRAMEANALKHGIEGITLKLESITMKPEIVSEDAKDLLHKLWTPDPMLRIGANGVEEIMNHPYFTGINWEKLKTKDVVAPFIPKSHEINASSMHDIGNFQGLKDMVLTPEDNKHFENFEVVNMERKQNEIYRALVRLDQYTRENKGKPKKGNGSCCTMQ